MRKEDFNFDLAEELIAQGSSWRIVQIRLLVLDKETERQNIMCSEKS